jgi:hypothetical protein
MPEERHPNPEPWDDWKNFPEGRVKSAIEAIWDDNIVWDDSIESEEKVGAHFALQVKGNNPISGYRVWVV